MDTLLKSSVEKKLTRILYRNAKGDQPSLRTIEPIGVFNENGNWYLLAIAIPDVIIGISDWIQYKD